MSARHAQQPGARTTQLLARTEQVRSALERAGTALPEDVRAEVEAMLDGVAARLELGVDHTVVALVGGTGSGKSSLFNALAGLDLADVGVRRPTTSQVTACVWAHDAAALLDWLEVPVTRRFERESALDGESQADLRGLVLLDLPDHDSVEPEHRAVVDRVLPHADLVLVVVDPQKYADDALHTGYLRHLHGHEASMLVVLNQLDTVPESARDAVLEDVGRLLHEDGLAHVAVRGASAATGDGVAGLRGALAEAVGAHGLAEVRAAAELRDAARALGRAAAGREAVDVPVERAVDELATAVGLDGARRAAADPAAPHDATAVGPAHADRVGRTRERWLETVADGLPPSWTERLERELPTGAELRAAVDERLADVRPPRMRTGARTVLRAVAAAVGLAALVVLGLCVGTVVGAGRWTDTATLLAGVAACGGLVAALLLVLARTVARRHGRRRADALVDDVRTRLTEAVEAQLAAPTREVLAAHRGVREVATDLSTDLAPTAPSTA